MSDKTARTETGSSPPCASIPLMQAIDSIPSGSRVIGTLPARLVYAAPDGTIKTIDIPERIEPMAKKRKGKGKGKGC